jgi:hypothetical protein
MKQKKRLKANKMRISKLKKGLNSKRKVELTACSKKTGEVHFGKVTGVTAAVLGAGLGAGYLLSQMLAEPAAAKG